MLAQWRRWLGWPCPRDFPWRQLQSLCDFGSPLISLGYPIPYRVLVLRDDSSPASAPELALLVCLVFAMGVIGIVPHNPVAFRDALEYDQRTREMLSRDRPVTAPAVAAGAGVASWAGAVGHLVWSSRTSSVGGVAGAPSAYHTCVCR